MAVNEALTAYKRTAASNTPAGTDAVGPDLDDHLRDMKKNIIYASQRPTKEISASYSATITDHTYLLLVDASAGAVTVTLPAASTASDGYSLAIKKIDSSVNAVTIDGDGAETIDGTATLSLAKQFDSVGLVCDGTAMRRLDREPNAARLNETNVFTKQATFSARVLQAQGTAVSATAALTLGTDGNLFQVNGADPISSIAAIQIGTIVTLKFNGAAVMRHDATKLIIPSETDITATAGEVISLIEESSGTFRVISSPGRWQKASTTLVGSVRFGTDAEQLSGVATDVALTPAGFASGSSIASAGYYKLPGGLIIQWASGSVTGTSSVTLPLTFPNNHWQCIGNLATASVGNINQGHAAVSSTSAAGIYNTQGSSWTVSFVSFGN